MKTEVSAASKSAKFPPANRSNIELLIIKDLDPGLAADCRIDSISTPSRVMAESTCPRHRKELKVKMIAKIVICNSVFLNVQGPHQKRFQDNRFRNFRTLKSGMKDIIPITHT